MLPPIYVDATLRNVTPVCPTRQRFGLGFEVDAGGGHNMMVRVAITTAQAEFLQAALGDYISSLAGSQSAGSELSPSDPVSVPSEGVNTCPPATSSTAP